MIADSFQKSFKIFKEMINFKNLPIFLVDKKGKILYVNSKGEKIIVKRYPVGKKGPTSSVFDLVPDDYKPNIQDLINEVFDQRSEGRSNKKRHNEPHEKIGFLSNVEH